MEVVQLTEDEADARLMIEAGLSFEEVSSLTLYWKRLLLGYKEKKVEQKATIDQIRKLSQRFKMTQGGWRTPNG